MNFSMSKTEAQNSKFDWVKQSDVRRTSCKSTANVTISKRIGSRLKDGTVTYRVAFIFRGGIEKQLAPNDYVEIAVYKNRIMFRESNEQDGFLLKSRAQTSAEFLVPMIEDTKELQKFWDKDYELKYDDFYDVYYVERVIGFEKYKVEL